MTIRRKTGHIVYNHELTDMRPVLKDGRLHLRAEGIMPDGLRGEVVLSEQATTALVESIAESLERPVRVVMPDGRTLVASGRTVIDK